MIIRHTLAIVAWSLVALNSYAATDAGIPGLEFLQLPANASIGEVLARLYIWGIGFVALAAFLMFTWGGVLYMIAGDKDPSEAKSKMRNAIYGLLLALGSYLILDTINPALVNIANLELPEIKQSANPTTTSTNCAQNQPPNCGTGCQEIINAAGQQLCEPIQPTQYRCINTGGYCIGGTFNNHTCNNTCPRTCLPVNLCSNAPPPPPTPGDYRCKLPNSDVCGVNGYNDSSCNNACPGRCVIRGDGCRG